MKAPVPRAFCAGRALVTSIPAHQQRLCAASRLRAARRHFHASSRFWSNAAAAPAPAPGGGNGKPADGSTAEQSGASPDDVFEPTTTVDVSVGRARTHAAGSLRSRQARRRIASSLPPVKIPQHFLDENVSIHIPEVRPRLPLALQEDVQLTKKTRPFRPARTSRQEKTDLLWYFETAYMTLSLQDLELRMDLAMWSSSPDTSKYDWSTPEPYERVVRLHDMLIDTLKNFTDTMYQTKETKLTYKKRPWWWWDVQRDVDSETQMFGGSSGRDAHVRNMAMLLNHGTMFDHSLADSILDFSTETFDVLRGAMRRELGTTAPSNFDSKGGKRPINILTMEGYGGKALSESIADLLAHYNGADLVRLDAYDLSVLVGDYLGQNWAYSRGPLSMLGFRAAELAGRLASEPETSSSLHYSRPAEEEHDDETDMAATPGGLRAAAHSLEDELQKIRQGAYDCFNKWELLKIDKILDQIIRSNKLKSDAGAANTQSRPVLIHIHDFVELSMTMEGTVLIGRLRALVDAAWQQGVHIAILGTSAAEEPSDDYHNAVRELSVGDFVVTRHIKGHNDLPAKQPVEETESSGTQHFSRRVPWDLLAADYGFENINNINRMLRAMNPDSSQKLLNAQEASHRPAYDALRGPILPISEVYHLASTYRALENEASGRGDNEFTTALGGQLVKRTAQAMVYDDDDAPEPRSPKDAPHAHAGDPLQEGRYGKLNEYEKRVASGQVKRENLRTTFDDVHVPKEVISSLKVLTSLALIRPDAFSYGVLAQDRIPGCLLYGPPGTGKTMLAKAVAKESGANMLEISGASINDKWVGESEKLIRAVFTMAKRLSPCVVFIDEADSILANRTLFNRASHRELINQFLKEWDGMEQTNAFIMVATNRPFDLDDAVLRRLPRKLLIDLPTREDRAAILRLLLRGERTAADVDVEDLAKRTPLYSGSDLKNVCVAAAMSAVEEENEAAALHEKSNGSGEDGKAGHTPYVFPERRTLRADHFERGLKQIPASISEDMVSLKMIRKFDEEYGKGGGRKGGRQSMGFGVLDPDGGEAARVRQYEP